MHAAQKPGTQKSRRESITAIEEHGNAPLIWSPLLNRGALEGHISVYLLVDFIRNVNPNLGTYVCSGLTAQICCRMLTGTNFSMEERAKHG